MAAYPPKRTHYASTHQFARIQLSPGFAVYKPSSDLHLLVCSPGALPSLPNPFCLVLIASDAECCIGGKFSLTHLVGPSISVLGASLKADPSHSITMFSPNSHALLTITQTRMASDAATHFAQDHLKSLFSEHFPVAFVDFLCSTVFESVSQMTSCPSMILLRPFQCRITDAITNVKRFRTLYSSFGGILTSNDSKTLGFDFFSNSTVHGFRISPSMQELSDMFVNQWHSFLSAYWKSDSKENHHRSPVLLIAGPKSAGKSSLVRFVINRFLTTTHFPTQLGSHGHDGSKACEDAVAVLDCDIGQPEFTASGMVSLTLLRRPLFGPPFSHQILSEPKPLRKCFVGCTSPSENPQFYLDCLEFVYDAYRHLPAPQPPLIVNTMGWTQGLGLTLLVEQILLVRPSTIAQIQLHPNQAGVRHNLPILDSETLRSIGGWKSQDLSGEDFTHQVLVIHSMTSCADPHLPKVPSAQLGAPDHRDLTLLAYFTATLATAPTSLPALGPNDPLGHPVAHFLDCLPYRISLIRSTVTDEPMADRSDRAVITEDAANEVKEDEEEASLAVCLMHPITGLFPGEKACPIKLSVDTVLACLNATLVALCAVPPELIENNVDSRTCPIIPFMPVCECLGLAICRAIDPSAGILYLTTGVPTEDLKKVTGIIRGSVNLPQFFFLEQPIPDPPSGSPEPVVLPYVGPAETQGLGRTGLPARRSYPRTLHHTIHRTGSSDMFELS